MVFSLSDFTYTLPPELLAHKAAEPRDSARLLRWPEGDVRVFKELPDFLNAGDVLVVNTSAVIPARLYCVRPARDAQGSDVPVEVLLHQAHDSSLATWQAFAKPTKRLRVGDVLTVDGSPALEVTAMGGAFEENRGQIVVRLLAENIPAFLQEYGHTPLPPYINSDDSPEVRARYQTVYADETRAGSVAAPTAGLHFTPAVFEGLKAKGVQVVYVTLHVGAGTFLNPTPEQVESRRLHAEWAEVPSETAQAVLAAKARGNAVVAVGTTSLRTLESWGQQGLPAGGWKDATRLFIQPGFEFKVVDKLVTNFHLPESSLLMLVSTFLGATPEQPHAWKPVYERAMAEGLRFYSFGDSSLLTRG